MLAQRAIAVDNTEAGAADLAPQIAVCAAARAALEKAKRARSERPDRMRAAKTKVADSQFQRDKLQTEYDAGGDVDYNKLAMLDTAAKAAEAELDSTVRSAHADNAAIETLRGRLTDAHAALCIAMAPQVDRARAVARAKYAAGLQEIRDAVVILGRTDDEMLPLRMKIPDIEPGGFAFGRVTPSPDVVDLLLEFDAGIRERDVALRAMIR